MRTDFESCSLFISVQCMLFSVTRLTCIGSSIAPILSDIYVSRCDRVIEKVWKVMLAFSYMWTIIWGLFKHRKRLKQPILSRKR